MCLDSRLLRVAICMAGSLVVSSAVLAQNTAMPYSILGIGNIDQFDFGRYATSGSAAAGRRDEMAYNGGNPAAISAMSFKNVFFDMSMRGRVSSYLLPRQTLRTTGSKHFVLQEAKTL